MAKYMIEECANANMAGRIDTAVIYDTTISEEKIESWESTFGTSEFKGWQDNPAIEAIFEKIDENDDEYCKWLAEHKGEYEYE